MTPQVPKFDLLSGRTIPSVGLGTYTLFSKQDVTKTLDLALAAGYRLIDTAAMYDNEHAIGDTLKKLLPKHNLQRSDIFITSKLYPDDHGEEAMEAVADSLENLQCSYIDLYLIHWPGTFGPGNRTKLGKLRAASWAALVQAQAEGLVKDIGVSNYTVKHLTELLDNCYGVKPVVNQIEWHPYCHDEQIKQFCDKKGILVQGYMPLGGVGNTKLHSDPDVMRIAQNLNKTWPQILLRWAVQQNVSVIPKSKNKDHLEANIDLNFTIPPEDMAVLSNSKILRRVDWDPNVVP